MLSRVVKLLLCAYYYYYYFIYLNNLLLLLLRHIFEQPITITITITGSIWPDYYYYYYSRILRSLLLLLLLLIHKSVITITITIIISNSLLAMMLSCLVKSDNHHQYISCPTWVKKLHSSMYYTHSCTKKLRSNLLIPFWCVHISTSWHKRKML